MRAMLDGGRGSVNPPLDASSVTTYDAVVGIAQPLDAQQLARAWRLRVIALGSATVPLRRADELAALLEAFRMLDAEFERWWCYPSREERSGHGWKHDPPSEEEIDQARAVSAYRLWRSSRMDEALRSLHARFERALESGARREIDTVIDDVRTLFESYERFVREEKTRRYE